MTQAVLSQNSLRLSSTCKCGCTHFTTEVQNPEIGAHNRALYSQENMNNMISMADKPNLLIIAGTRPEAIKVAPIVLEIAARSTLTYKVIDTCQHPDMLIAALADFGITADLCADLQRLTGSLPELAARLFETLEQTLSESRFDGVIVQGDTLSTGIAAQAAFFMKVPVFHVEAGLRSHDLENPFPEEGIRRIVSQMARRHYCPSDLARQNLLAEGVPSNRIVVTGNTVIDAVRLLGPKANEIDFGHIEGLDGYVPLDDGLQILVTCHRRENHGEPLRSILDAVVTLHDQISNAHIILPVHPNPNVRTHIEAWLSDLDRVFLTPPLSYIQLMKVMKTSQVIVTDSGGIQEEAPSFGPDLFIIRKVTERPEVFQYPLAKLIGTEAKSIVDNVTAAWQRRQNDTENAAVVNPFGDGHAARYIVDDIEAFFRPGRD